MVLTTDTIATVARGVLSCLIYASMYLAGPALAQADHVALYGPPDVDGAKQLPHTPPAIPQALDQAAALASEAHPTVEAAEAEADALTAEYRGARWGRFPSLTVEALAATKGSSIAGSDGLALNAALEQPVWAGGRITGEIERARANQRAGEDRVEVAKQGIVSRVIQAYYDLATAESRLAVLEKSLQEHQELLVSIGRRVDQEVSPRADLVLGRSRLAQVELDIVNAQQMRANARQQLRELTGGTPVESVVPPMEVTHLLPPEDLALTEAIGCDPNLAVLADMINVAEADGDIARSGLMPQVLLQLSLNEITGTRGAVVLRMQLGNGGAQFAAIDSAEARTKRALANYSETERQVREELQRNYILVRAANAQMQAGDLAADAADQIVQSYRRQFIAGRRSWLDVMNAVSEAAQARLSAGDARIMAGLGAANILARTCRWQPGGK